MDDTPLFDGKKILTAYIDHHIKRAFEKYCADRDIKVSDVVQQHIEDLLARARIDPEDFKGVY